MRAEQRRPAELPLHQMRLQCLRTTSWELKQPPDQSQTRNAYSLRVGPYQGSAPCTVRRMAQFPGKHTSNLRRLFGALGREARSYSREARSYSWL